MLGDWERIPVCVAYDIDGVRHDEMPMTQSEFHHAKPVYEYFDGWQEDISGCRTFEDLPKNAQAYVRALEEMSGAPFWARRRRPGPRADRSSCARPPEGARSSSSAPAAASTPWPSRCSRDPGVTAGARRARQPGHGRRRRRCTTSTRSTAQAVAALAE